MVYNGMYILSFYIFTLIKCNTVLNPSKIPQTNEEQHFWCSVLFSIVQLSTSLKNNVPKPRLTHWTEIVWVIGSMAVELPFRMTDFLRVEHSNIATCCTWATPKITKTHSKPKKKREKAVANHWITPQILRKLSIYWMVGVSIPPIVGSPTINSLCSNSMPAQIIIWSHLSRTGKRQPSKAQEKWRHLKSTSLNF